MENSLDKEIEKRLLEWLKMKRAHLAIGVIANLLGFVVLFFIYRAEFGLDYAFQNTFQSYSNWIVVEGIIIVLYFLYLAFGKLPSDIYKEQREIIDSLKPGQLNILVSQGRGDFINVDGSGFFPCLIIDVVNFETRKILEMDAHLSVHYWQEDDPDDRTSGYASFPNGRMKWDDNTFEIEIKPGFDSVRKIQLATLKETNGQFMFIHEGTLTPYPHFQENALYEVTIDLQGKLEGKKPDFRNFQYKTEFICLPKARLMFFVNGDEEFTNIPDGLKRKLLPTRNP